MDNLGLRNTILTVSTVIVLFTLLGLVGCSSTNQSSTTTNSTVASNQNHASNPNNAALKDVQKKLSNEDTNSWLVSASTKFGLKLYREIVKQSAGKNVFISPASVMLALSMVYNGAEGETRQAMARTLGVDAMSLEDVNHANAQLKTALEEADPQIQLEIANSLWVRKGLAFSPDFLERNKRFYGAEAAELNFNDPSASSIINSWVSDKTHGKIGKIVDDIDPQTVLFIINAIYFKGKWAVQFDQANTKEDLFTLADGKQKKHQMMSQSGSYGYYENKNFQAVKLPYGNKRISMSIFLPSKDSSLEEFHQSLTSDNWESWMSHFAQTQGEISLPRFKVEYEVTLNDALTALGMDAAFDPNRANFSGMLKPQSGERAFINEVKHKTFAEVNEEGTEAAAVTSVGMIPASAAPPPPKTFRMVVNRPFFYAIRDDRTGTVLFMGSITDPQ